MNVLGRIEGSTADAVIEVLEGAPVAVVALTPEGATILQGGVSRWLSAEALGFAPRVVLQDAAWLVLSDGRALVRLDRSALLSAAVEPVDLVGEGVAGFEGQGPLLLAPPSPLCVTRPAPGELVFWSATTGERLSVGAAEFDQGNVARWLLAAERRQLIASVPVAAAAEGGSTGIFSLEISSGASRPLAHQGPGQAWLAGGGQVLVAIQGRIEQEGATGLSALSEPDPVALELWGLDGFQHRPLWQTTLVPGNGGRIVEVPQAPISRDGLTMVIGLRGLVDRVYQVLDLAAMEPRHQVSDSGRHGVRLDVAGGAVLVGGRGWTEVRDRLGARRLPRALELLVPVDDGVHIAARGPREVEVFALRTGGCVLRWPHGGRAVERVAVGVGGAAVALLEGGEVVALGQIAPSEGQAAWSSVSAEERRRAARWIAGYLEVPAIGLDDLGAVLDRVMAWAPPGSRAAQLDAALKACRFSGEVAWRDPRGPALLDALPLDDAQRRIAARMCEEGPVELSGEVTVEEVAMCLVVARASEERTSRQAAALIRLLRERLILPRREPPVAEMAGWLCGDAGLDEAARVLSALEQAGLIEDEDMYIRSVRVLQGAVTLSADPERQAEAGADGLLALGAGRGPLSEALIGIGLLGAGDAQAPRIAHKLVADAAVELEDGASDAQIVPLVAWARGLARRRRGARLAEVLLDHPAIAEVYADDEALDKLLG